MAHMYTELQMIKEALQKYQNLIEAGFSKSTYIISQIAVAYHNIRGGFGTWSIIVLLISRSSWGSAAGLTGLWLRCDSRYRQSSGSVQQVEGPGSVSHRQHGHFLQPALRQSECSLFHQLGRCLELCPAPTPCQRVFIDLLLMFPQSMKPELSYLAHTLVEIDKYRVETCCVIGTCEGSRRARWSTTCY